MPHKLNSGIVMNGVDIGKNSLRGGARQTRCNRAAAEVVAWAGRSITVGQPAVVSNRNGGLRRGASPQPQAVDAGTRRSRQRTRVSTALLALSTATMEHSVLVPVL